MTRVRMSTRTRVVRWSVFLAAVAVILYFLQGGFFPWVHALTGTWYGEITTPTGRHWGAFITLRSAVGGRGHGPDIAGSARVCKEGGEVEAYDLTGDPKDWRGTRVSLTLSTVADRPDRLRLGALEGTRTGEELHVVTTLLLQNDPTRSIATTRDGARTRTGHPDTQAPVTFVLRRGGEREFADVCRRLVGSS